MFLVKAQRRKESKEDKSRKECLQSHLVFA